MPQDYGSTELAAALRDFFIASDAAGLGQAYRKIAEAAENAAPRVEDWREVEYSFTRLFVGPRALEAPPFATVYLEKEPLLMGPTTMTVRTVYQTLGLVSPWKNSLPEDHVSLELDAALVMRGMAQQSGSVELDELRRFFLCRHMALWIPEFTQSVSGAGSAHPAIIHAAGLLREWVAEEAAKLDGASHPSLRQGGVE
ncbi:MAG: molecular chaperone TorD family protein [Desulfohalobiaceae bacterium]|nr:molecular chaperone TorD family protein [Desulfohalobiaceae bacterium]